MIRQCFQLCSGFRRARLLPENTTSHTGTTSPPLSHETTDLTKLLKDVRKRVTKVLNLCKNTIHNEINTRYRDK